MRRGLPSERGDIDDLRVRELAVGIIKAQRKEIKAMDWQIADIECNGPATNEHEARQRRVPDFEGQAASLERRQLLAIGLRPLGIAPAPPASRP